MAAERIVCLALSIISQTNELLVLDMCDMYGVSLYTQIHAIYQIE